MEIERDRGSAGVIIEVIASLIAIGAGLYLLFEHSIVATTGDGQSWFEVLAHGIGAYFLARGLWMLRHAGIEDESRRLLGRLVWFAAAEHEQAPVGEDTDASWPAVQS